MKKLVGLTLIVAVTVALAGCSAARTKPDANASASTPAAITGLSHAEILYGYRCKGCHEPATPGAPSRNALADMDESEISDALRKGPMKSLATGLTRDEIRELAAFLSDEHKSK